MTERPQESRTLRDYLRVLRERRVLILACVLLVLSVVHRSIRPLLYGAAAAVTGTIAITSHSGGQGGFRRIATLTGAGNASGYVAVGRADGAVEPVVVSVNHLDPARDGQYYEIWFQTGGQQVPGVAFNAGSNGAATRRRPPSCTWSGTFPRRWRCRRGWPRRVAGWSPPVCGRASRGWTRPRKFY